MNVIGLREIEIDKLLLPGDWPKILNDPSVERRAKSIESVGLIHEPVVRAHDLKLGPGRRRVAAHVRMGKKTVLCKVIEATDWELDLMVLAENAEREHSPSKQAEAINKLVDLLAREKAEADPELRKGGQGRTKSAKGLAREEVAAHLGVKPASIAQREYRDRARAAKPSQRRAESLPEPDAASPAEPPPPPIVAPWVELDDVFVRDVARVQKAVDEVDKALLSGLSMLTRIKNAGLPCHADRIDKIHEELAMLGADVRGLRPTTLCPWCKGIDVIQVKCSPCRGSGYITKAQELNVPPELMAVVEPLVVYLGEKKPMAEFFDAEEPPVVPYEPNPFGLPDE